MSKATKENIRRLLALTGATQQQIADIAGVDRSAVGHWKSGKAEPRMGHLQRIADHYGITTANLADPNGMKYVYKGMDGRLHDDPDARLADLRRSVISLDTGHNVSDVMDIAIMVHSATQPRKITSDELELIDMYRSLNADGKAMARSVIASFVKSGSYSR